MSNDSRGDPLVTKVTISEPKHSAQTTTKFIGIGHWNAYSRSQDYLQRQPKDEKISITELEQHNKPESMWIALDNQGKLLVYDVTEFAKYHPGGCDILLQHAGTNATEAFIMAHSYINVNMISRFCQGTLSQNSRGRSGSANQLSPFSVSPVMRCLSSKKPVWNWSESSDGIVKFFVTYLNFHSSGVRDLDMLNVICMWRNLRDTKSGALLTLRVLLKEVYHCLEFHFVRTLQPGNSSIEMMPIAVNKTTANVYPIQLQLNLIRSLSDQSKPIKPLSTLGVILRDVIVPVTEENKYDKGQTFIKCRVVKSHHWSNNSIYQYLRIQPLSDVKIKFQIPLGHHVYLRLKNEQGKCICRPITPVSNALTYFSHQRNALVEDDGSSVEELVFLIRIYPDGEFSRLIDQLETNDFIEASLPVGYLSPNFIGQLVRKDIGVDCNNEHSESAQMQQTTTHYLYMLIGGSGITPMLRILHFILTHPHNIRIYLLWFNQKQSNVIMVNELDALHKQFSDCFFVKHILSEPTALSTDPDTWSNWISGTLSQEVCVHSLKQCEHWTDFNPDSHYLICGPPAFNEVAVNIVKSRSVNEDHYHVF